MLTGPDVVARDIAHPVKSASTSEGYRVNEGFRGVTPARLRPAGYHRGSFGPTRGRRDHTSTVPAAGGSYVMPTRATVAPGTEACQRHGVYWGSIAARGALAKECILTWRCAVPDWPWSGGKSKFRICLRNRGRRQGTTLEGCRIRYVNSALTADEAACVIQGRSASGAFACLQGWCIATPPAEAGAFVTRPMPLQEIQRRQ